MTSIDHFSSFRIGTFYKPNTSDQDRLFVYKSSTNEFIALCVVDGHGTYGKKVADNVLATLYELCSTTYGSFLEAPDAWFNKAFEIANNNLHMIGKHGGATCTLCIISNNILHFAHVGDSSALLTTHESIFNKNQSEKSVEFNYLLLGDDHSPDNFDEYQRMIKLNPLIKCVYDKSGVFPKYSLPSVFDNIKNIEYCKNVRCQPATLVTKEIGHALSMTRSLGDFQLKPEITHLPSIGSVDLTRFLGSSCLIIASDGVWDNWKYNDVHKFFINETARLSNVNEIAIAFEIENDNRATKNFGSSKDDACGIIVYF